MSSLLHHNARRVFRRELVEEFSRSQSAVGSALSMTMSELNENGQGSNGDAAAIQNISDLIRIGTQSGGM